MSDDLEKEKKTKEEIKEKEEPKQEPKEDSKKKSRKLILIAVISSIVLLILILLVIIFSIKKVIFSETSSFTIESIEKQSKGYYVNNNDTFIVNTKSGTLDEVKKNLYIEPAVSYDVKRLSMNKYEVTAHDIPSDSIVNFKYLDNEVVEDKWAFQSTKDLTVTSIYPSNNTSNNSTMTSIEIVFSYPDVEDINNSVVIDPPIEGKFTQNGRVWILKPTKPLQADTTYTITVKDTIKNSSEKLKETYKSTFSTYQNTNQTSNTTQVNYDSITLDNIATFKPSDNPMFITRGSIAKVEMHKFNSSEDFRKYIENETNYKTTSLGEVPIEKLNDYLYRINKKFETGYFLEKAYLSSGELYFQIPVQVNDLQAYLLSTQKDILVWTGSNNTLLKDIDVKYGTNNTKTDESGIAVIKNYNDKSKKLKYVKVGKDNPLFIGINNTDNEQLPNAYIYTDRPLYKNTDDINIFGYIPLKYFEEQNISKQDFVLSFNNEKIPIEIEDDGTFTTKYHLDNIKDNYYSIELKYKDKVIGSRGIHIYKYEKEMYNFIINMDKNYVKAGNKFHFTVGVQHISGVMVPNKEIQVIYEDKVLKGITDYKGIASFDLDTTQESSPDIRYNSKYVTVKSTLTESSQSGYNFSFYVIHRYLSSSNSNYNPKTKLYTANINNLSDNKNVQKVSFDIKELIDTPYIGSADIELVETTSVRSISGYTYNQITKENMPTYSYTSSKETVKTDKININDGNLKYTINYNFKKSTEDTSYSYNLAITMKDKNGTQTRYTNYISVNENNSSSNGHMRYDYMFSSMPSYNLYGYYMPIEERQYSINEQIIRNIYSYTGAKEENDNKVLLIKYKNSIVGKKIVNGTTNIRTNFDDNNRPGLNIVGAYLKDGVFHRLPSEYLDYKEDDSKLDITLNTNKKTYTPSEEVEVNIKVNKKDKGIKSKVNISVVDEGVFKTQEDYTNIVAQLYNNKNYYKYLYSTYRDYSLYTIGGGAGSTSGNARADFGDTIFFKTIDTDSNGNAKVKFKLNDSITSFRITAHATTNNVDANATHINIESSLPVSISFTEPRGLKTTDDVVLNALGIGSSKDTINYEFTLEGTNKVIKKQGNISQTVYANFGKLKAGKYKVTITAKTKKYTDKVQYEFIVGTTQLETSIKNTSPISKVKKIKPTKNPIKLEIYRASYKKYEKYLEIIKNTNEDRLDTKFTYNKALEYENKYNKTNNISELGDISKFKADNGYKYLPGEEISYELTAILSYYDESLRLDKTKYYKMLNTTDPKQRMNAYLVLASMKEPILDDLKKDESLFSASYDQLAMAYVFLGDYSAARRIENNITDIGIKAYVTTFINKDHAAAHIDNLYKNDIANKYLYFSIISYFENNNVELNNTEEVVVSYGKETKKLNINPLGKESLVIYQKDLNELNINSRYKDIYVNYYYEGTPEEVAKDSKEENIKISLANETPKLGDMTNLTIDVSNISNNQIIKLYLPNGLRLSNGFKSDFAYVVSNDSDKVAIYLGEKKGNTISLPLYLTSPGEYKLEPIIIKNGDKYQMSNSIKVKVIE